jgi:hypothetical protein
MIYACPTRELAIDTYLLQLQRMRNKVLHTIESFLRCTPVCDLHTAFNLPYVYDYITKLCRQQAEVIQNHENVRGIGQGEARHRKYKDYDRKGSVGKTKSLVVNLKGPGSKTK